MSDIFISYKREDRSMVDRLAKALEGAGYDVWYDFELLTGDSFRGIIRRIIDKSTVTIVVWSARAVTSDFVLDEATHARTRGTLLPVRIDDTELPLGFGQIQTDSLADWAGELDHPGFSRLLRSIRSRVPEPSQNSGSHEPAGGVEELMALKEAVMAPNNSGLRKFLTRFPTGTFAAVARAELKERNKLGNRWNRLPLILRCIIAVLIAASILGGLVVVTRTTIHSVISQETAGTPEPLSESKLVELARQSIEMIANGQVPEELIMEPLLSACRRDLETMRVVIAPLGKILEIKNEGYLRSVNGPVKVTRLFVKFERGQMRWEVKGDPSGRLIGFWSTGTINEQ